MATITGLTAARMAVIEAAQIMGAHLTGTHLILERHDGTLVDVGPVKGDPGPTGPAGLTLSALSNRQIFDTGLANQIRAGRQLALADFTTLCALPSTPVGLFNLGSTANLGSGGALTNKGTVTFGPDIVAAASQAAVFNGSVAQALFINDTGSADPFRIKAGTIGCWFKATQRGVAQILISKRVVGTSLSFALFVQNTNVVSVSTSVDGTTAITGSGAADVADGRWHHAAVSIDGTTQRLYVDGVLVTSTSHQGLLFGSAGALVIGAQASDTLATPTTQLPMFGSIDEAFVTEDVLTPEQINLLYAAKIAHGYAGTPKLVLVNAHRKRKGPALATADFPSTPIRLYNLSNLNDLGSNNVPLTANAGSGSIGQTTGPDGSKASARAYLGAHNGDSGTDAGMPAALTSRTFGCWVKLRNTAINGAILGWGTTNPEKLYTVIGGAISSASNTDVITGPNIADGNWHFVVVVEDNTAADGLKRKLFVDGKLVGTSTTLNSLTLGGANFFRVGANPDGTVPFDGQIARVFVHTTAFTPDQIRSLYLKGSQDPGISPRNSADHILGVDATNLYATFDALEGQVTVDMAVAA